MRRTMTIAGVLALAGTCLLAQEPRTGDTRTEDRTGAAATTLPLRLQQGQTFEFRLQVNEKPSQWVLR